MFNGCLTLRNSLRVRIVLGMNEWSCWTPMGRSLQRNQWSRRVGDTRNSREKMTTFGIVFVVPSLASFSASFVTLDFRQSVSRDCSAPLGTFYWNPRCGTNERAKRLGTWWKTSADKYDYIRYLHLSTARTQKYRVRPSEIRAIAKPATNKFQLPLICWKKHHDLSRESLSVQGIVNLLEAQCTEL